MTVQNYNIRVVERKYSSSNKLQMTIDAIYFVQYIIQLFRIFKT